MPKKAMTAPVIKVNAQFSITSDEHQWILRETRKAKSRKNPGQTVERVRETFHGKLSHVFNEIVERDLKGAQSLAAMKGRLPGLRAEIKQACEGIELAYVQTKGN